MHATPKVSGVVIRHPRLVLCPHLTALAEFAIAQTVAFRISLFSRLLFIFFFLCVCDGKVEGHCGISLFVLIVIQISVSCILCEYRWA